MSEDLALSAEHDAAWRWWLRAHALLVRTLDADLRAEHGMTLLTYEALAQLAEAPDQRLHMKDLAAALVYSASGLTRIVDGLERSGYARRETDPANRRATLVCLTQTGYEAQRAAMPTHTSRVRAHFAGHATQVQARALGSVFRAVIDDLDHTSPASL